MRFTGNGLPNADGEEQQQQTNHEWAQKKKKRSEKKYQELYVKRLKNPVARVCGRDTMPI